MTADVHIDLDGSPCPVSGLQGASADYFAGLLARVAKALSLTPESCLAALEAMTLPTGAKLAATIHRERTVVTFELTAAQVEALLTKAEKVVPTLRAFAPLAKQALGGAL